MVALPRVEGHDLSFHFVDGPDDLEEGRWGIPEPAHDRPVLLSELDAALVPLLVFDSRCARAGRGGGFYDRALAPLAGRDAPAKPILIGVADDEDEVPVVPVRSHDVALDAVVTPSRVHRARARESR
jgi:5-formyltetrahydrofolate cyclo-ligase